MIHTVQIPRSVYVEEYYVLRAILDSGGSKKVIKERAFSVRPELKDIAAFLEETKANFISVENNYRLAHEDDLPFR